MIHLDLPDELERLRAQLRVVAETKLRPISRRCDSEEHVFPVELLEVARILDELVPREYPELRRPLGDGVRNGASMRTVVAYETLCWGDVGLMLAMPGRGLGSEAIAAVGSPEQIARFGKCYAAMCSTEPGAGSDLARISTTAVLDGDNWVLNGEKIFVTAGTRCEIFVVWATLDRTRGKAAIKAFVVERNTAGCEVTRVERKLGLRASDTAAVSFRDCRIPRSNLLGSADIVDDAEGRRKAFGGVMRTFDNSRPPGSAMAVGCARAALDLTREILAREGVALRLDASPLQQTAVEAELLRMEAELEGARLLVLRAAWMIDNGMPNSLEASMCKAKAGRVGNEITLRCVELCRSVGYSEDELLEKFARDSKIIDIFGGTQQIQQLIVARHVLGKSSRELK